MFFTGVVTLFLHVQHPTLLVLTSREDVTNNFRRVSPPNRDWRIIQKNTGQNSKLYHVLFFLRACSSLFSSILINIIQRLQNTSKFSSGHKMFMSEIIAFSCRLAIWVHQVVKSLKNDTDSRGIQCKWCLASGR